MDETERGHYSGLREHSPQPSEYLMLSEHGDHDASRKASTIETEEDDRLGVRRFLALVAMSFLWTASQIPLYFYGGIEPQILTEVGGANESTWIALGNLLPLAIVTPFVGALSDLFGRKYVGIAAFVFIIVGNAVSATAHTIYVFIAGSVLTGIGGGIGELVSLAVAGEVAPVKKRGIYVSAIAVSIVPFAPAVLYAQLLASVASWRWVGLLIGGWSFIGLVLTCIFYRPPPRQTLYSRRQLAKRIDYVGGALSAAGLTLFLVGLTFAAKGDAWNGIMVLVPVIVGLALIVGFGLWEGFFVKYPIFPARLKEKNPRALTVILLITFASGANFFAVLIYWPSQYQNVYAQENNPISQGVGSLPVGFGIIFGSIIGTYLVSAMRGRIRLVIIGCTVVMAAANGAMAAARIDNLPTLWPIVTLACVGVGAVIVPTQVIAGIICPTDLIATITAATIAVRVLGGAIAYAVYYIIFSNKFQSLVPTTIAPLAHKFGINSTEVIGEIAEAIQYGEFESLLEIPGITQAHYLELVDTGRLALSESYPQVYYVSIAFGAVAVIASLFLVGVDENIDEQGAAVKL